MVHPVPPSNDEVRAQIAQEQAADTVESVVPLMPIVLPLAGGVLMFLLAFIAIYMA
ncbi:hypothetical protein [Xylophilus sp.]|uniref:hypothetical protein n=1 Tax=Xylophilus sp. TaxID=2653893 RepID=UPI0013B67487|nr:hypothetical protein [Xylophilus sp.]KAF1050095.1 MAG: hypothetical protein GAK38_00120 [Xylophilus sp.]